MSLFKASKEKLLVAAIDFGTKFSSWAFSFKNEYQKNPTRIFTKNWNSGTSISHKAPTTALIRSDGVTLEAFGYDAEDKYSQLATESNYTNWYYFERFKMSLFENKSLTRETKIQDVTGKKLKAITVFSLVIEYLKNNLVEECRSKIAIGEFHEEYIHWVLTVPAIWNDNAKHFMREAAVQAGIREELLMIALEPEAASLFCRNIPLHLMSPEEKRALIPLNVGTCYIVIDAGGGTVDITIHEIMKDGKLKELHKATGGAWGGQEVDENFKQFLIKIFGNPVLQKFKTEALDDYIVLFREFELKKRKVTPVGEEKVIIAIPATLVQLFENETGETLDKSIAQTEFASLIEVLKGNKLRIDLSVMRSFFEKSTRCVAEHIKSFHDSDKYAVTVALMVGGFSESPMLVNAVIKACPSWKVVVPDEAGLVVLKGAVIFGHNPTPVAYRVSRYTYGYETTQPFIKGEHSENQMILVDGEKICQNIFIPFLQEGELIYDGQIFVDRCKCYPAGDADLFRLSIHASSDKNIRYTTDKGCTYLGLLTVDNLDMNVSRTKRVALVTIKVKNSELQVEATDPNTRKILKAFIDFL